MTAPLSGLLLPHLAVSMTLPEEIGETSTARGNVLQALVEVPKELPSLDHLDYEA